MVLGIKQDKTEPLNFCHKGGFLVGPHAEIPSDTSVYLSEKGYHEYYDSKGKQQLIGCNSIVCDQCKLPGEKSKSD